MQLRFLWIRNKLVLTHTIFEVNKSEYYDNVTAAIKIRVLQRDSGRL